jgi:O-Antigen ligase
MADGIMVDKQRFSRRRKVGRLGHLMRIHLNRSILLSPLSAIFIPLNFFPSYFDRNASVNFILLCLAAIVCAVFIFRSNNLDIPPLVAYLIFALILGTTISLAINVGKINMLTGDTGRYTGLISLFALLLIAISYTQVLVENFQWHLRWLLVAVVVVDIFGLIQYLELYKLPTGAGIGSTLGNSDFFSAWLGTSAILIFALKYHRKKIQYLIQSLFLIFTIFLMSVIDVKQGFIDLIILLFLLVLYRNLSRFRALNWGERFWTAAISFFTIVWFELIFLLPMAKIKIPFFTDDIQVTIRTHFWNAGMQMFFNHIPFGVGPDNYGNYYEKYRSLDSFKLTEFVLSNDAHSSVVQTFATLGLVNIIIFTALWVLLVRALVVNIFRRPEHRTIYFVIGGYFLIFATNSMISPITLPNKFIFWALAGFVIGSAAHLNEFSIKDLNLKVFKGVTVFLAILIAFVSINFSLAQMSFINSLSVAKKNPSNISYNYNPYLPCVIYFPVQLDLAAANGHSSKLQVANDQIKNNQRCLYAQMYLAETAIANKDWVASKLLVNNLIEIAPARREVISIAAVYALKAGDKELQKRLVSQGEFLGLINATGSVPQSPPKLK